VADRLGPAARAAVGGGGDRVARLARPAAEIGLVATGRVKDLAHPLDVAVPAAVRGARDREMVRAQPEALGHARLQPGQRLERLGRGADEHRGPGLALAVGHRPGDAVLALDRRAPVHAHDGLPDHDARTW
jgi:hypothetical protein